MAAEYASRVSVRFRGFAAGNRLSAVLTAMPPVLAVRHLLRAKDTIDARYRDPLDVATMTGGPALRGPLQPRVPPRVRRDPAPVPADAPAGAGRGPAPQHRSLGGRDLHGRRAAQRRLLHDVLRPRLRHVADRLPGRVSPAIDRAMIPTCVLRERMRPASSTFREDHRAGPQ